LEADERCSQLETMDRLKIFQVFTLFDFWYSICLMFLLGLTVHGCRNMLVIWRKKRKSRGEYKRFLLGVHSYAFALKVMMVY